MSNIIQIKRGTDTPPEGALAPYELGFVSYYIADEQGNSINNEKTDAGYLYIGQPSKSNGIDKINNLPVRTHHATTADSATTATTATSLQIQNGGTTSTISTMENLKSLILDMTYPVGSIYMSTDDNSPADFLGGTWERIKEVFLLGANDDSETYQAGSTGGEATHTLTVNEMPQHIHGLFADDGTGQGGSWVLKADIGHGTNTEGSTAAIESTGGDQPHNNMPPYLAVYMWKRIA